MRHLLLLLCVLVVATPAKAEWWEARTDHFIVYSEDSAVATREFATRLERLDMALRSLQPSDAPVRSDAQRLTVFRFGNIAEIGRLADAQQVAGFYISRASGSVVFTPAKSDSPVREGIIRRDGRTNLDPQSVLFHEYAHHFMYQNRAAAYPSWYVEGFAEMVAALELKPDGSFVIGGIPQYRSDALFDPMITRNATKLLTIANRPTAQDQYSHYTMGWLLTHYLTFKRSRQGQLKAYLKSINAGVAPAEAARQSFGDLRKLDDELSRYKATGNLAAAHIRPTTYSPPTVTMRKLSPDEEAIIRVKIRSKRGVDKNSSGAVAADARRVAQSYPQSFPVQLALAEAELDARQYAAAEAAVDRALTMKRDSVEAMLIKGGIHYGLGKKDKEHLKTARTWFKNAYTADPYQPAALYYNYLTYHREGGPIPESAIIGLEQAFELAPFDSSYRFVLGRQLLSERKGELAKSVLIPVAIAPHASTLAKVVREVIDLIDASQVMEAYNRLVLEMKKWEDKAEEG